MEQFYEKLKKHIQGKFSNIHNIDKLSEDIMHDSYLIFKKREIEMMKLGEEIRDKYYYLFKIAERVAIKLYNYEVKNLKNSEIIENLETDSSNFDEDFELLYYKGQKLLTEMECMVINYRYFKEYSFNEIAELCNIKVNTLLSHHRRGLQKLRPFYSLAYQDQPYAKDLDEKELKYYNLLKY